MNNLHSLTVKQLRQAVAIKERIERLEAEIADIAGKAPGAVHRGGRRTKAAGKKRAVSAATRAKLAARAKARWAKVKAAGKTSL